MPEFFNATINVDSVITDIKIIINSYEACAFKMQGW